MCTHLTISHQPTIPGEWRRRDIWEWRKELTSRSGPALAGAALGLGILDVGARARAVSRGTGAARAAGAGDSVLSRGLGAVAVEGGLLAAGAGRLLGCLPVSYELGI